MKKLLTRALCALSAALLAVSGCAPCFAAAAPAPVTYTLSSRNLCYYYEDACYTAEEVAEGDLWYRGGPLQVGIEDMTESPYLYKDAQGHILTSNGTITMSVDSAGAVSISLPASHNSYYESEHPALEITGRFVRPSDNKSYGGGVYYVDEAGKPQGYSLNDLKFVGGRADITGGPSDMPDWHYELQESSLSALNCRTVVNEDGTVDLLLNGELSEYWPEHISSPFDVKARILGVNVSGKTGHWQLVKTENSNPLSYADEDSTKKITSSEGQYGLKIKVENASYSSEAKASLPKERYEAEEQFAINVSIDTQDALSGYEDSKGTQWITEYDSFKARLSDTELEPYQFDFMGNSACIPVVKGEKPDDPTQYARDGVGTALVDQTTGRDGIFLENPDEKMGSYSASGTLTGRFPAGHAGRIGLVYGFNSNEAWTLFTYEWVLDDEEAPKQEEEERFYWKYDDMKTETDYSAGRYITKEGNSYTYDNGDRKYSWQWIQINKGYTFVYQCDYNNTQEYDTTHDQEKCENEHAAYDITVDDIKRDYKPGETLNLCMRIDGTKSESLCPTLYTQAFAYFTQLNPSRKDPLNLNGKETSLTDSSGESSLHFAFQSTHAPDDGVSKEVSAKFPAKAKEGDIIYVVFHTQAEGILIDTGFRYVYTKGVPAGGGTVGIKKGSGTISQKENREAWVKPGDDEGTDIITDIIAGLGAAGTAAAAAGAAAGAANQSAEDKKRKTSRYKMIIYKDFGDSIAKGQPPVGVFARIAEYDEDGNETDCPLLTQDIHLFSETEGLSVRETGMINSYMGAEVCVPGEGSQLHEGIVSARISGRGGFFTERVTFRIIGRAYLDTYNTDSQQIEQLVLLSGDGKTYDMYVCACDFANDATSLSAEFSYPEGCRDTLVHMSYERVDRFTFLCHFSNVNDK